MPTPPKPFSVLQSEKKSHRTKKELSQRKQGEAALSTGEEMRERKEVKENPLAHKEYIRLKKLLKKIEKNDAICEVIINRYCLMIAECIELEQRREEIYALIVELKETKEEAIGELEGKEKPIYLIEFTKQLGKLVASMMSLDKAVQTKRKMLLDIEKENIMTIASSLRNIPKKVENSKNDELRRILSGM